MFFYTNKKIKRSFSLLLALLCVTTVFAASKKAKNFNLPKKELVVTCADGKKVSIVAEIAKSEEARNYGFMERKNIPDGTGMLFVFENDMILRFWMKNTPTALSIAYIDRNGKINEIFDMKPYSLESIEGTSYARYALEVPQGYFERAGIKAGDSIDLSVIK